MPKSEAKKRDAPSSSATCTAVATNRNGCSISCTSARGTTSFSSAIFCRAAPIRRRPSIVRRTGARGVRGNHDETLSKWRSRRPSRATTVRLGKAKRKLAAELEAADWAVLESLDLFIDLPDHELRLVHAGVVPGVPIDEQDEQALLSMRYLGPHNEPIEKMASLAAKSSRRTASCSGDAATRGRPTSSLVTTRSPSRSCTRGPPASTPARLRRTSDGDGARKRSARAPARGAARRALFGARQRALLRPARALIRARDRALRWPSVNQGCGRVTREGEPPSRQGRQGIGERRLVHQLRRRTSGGIQRISHSPENLGVLGAWRLTSPMRSLKPSRIVGSDAGALRRGNLGP